nr:glycosyltransferase [Gemmatimonadota bacterium]NIQ54269.1 glycosyltransferase [Gemmatimonadota bacterium]NIU74480.1 glycosyltransferase [Gammaproteobacteria bacterium]NIX44443.1 glycosyltransferase [Gemmatimonadota bacterium]NIY08668.1 glycosyltransferase [Gemmatimonadota bacterium]
MNPPSVESRPGPSAAAANTGERFRVALFLPALAGGGAERVMVNLGRGLVERGMDVDMVLCRVEGEYLDQLPGDVRLVDLEGRRVLLSVAALARYLRRERPDVLLSTLNTANIAAVAAQRLAGVPTRTLLRQSNVLANPTRATGRPLTPLTLALVRFSYARADAIVAVSESVAEDLRSLPGVKPGRVHAVPNPVVGREHLAMADRPVPHPWLREPGPPVVLAAGRLHAQKDYPTLLEAVALVHHRRPVRLIVLGDGPDREALEARTRELGIQAYVSMPGFTDNPFAYMARAAAFVLSSAWEGMPGVLIQALACGAPVVSTE